MRYRITLYGFSETECRAMRFALEYPSAGEMGFEVVESLADADFAIVDADVPAAMKAIALAGRVARGLYIGASPPPEAPIVLTRPFDVARMRRSLLRLMARHGAESRGVQGPSTTDDPDEIIVFEPSIVGAIGGLPTRAEDLPPMPASEPVAPPSTWSVNSDDVPSPAPAISPSPTMPALPPRVQPRVAPVAMVPIPPFAVPPPAAPTSSIPLSAVPTIAPPARPLAGGPVKPPVEPPGGWSRFSPEPEVFDINDIPVLNSEVDIAQRREPAQPPEPRASTPARPAARVEPTFAPAQPSFPAVQSAPPVAPRTSTPVPPASPSIQRPFARIEPAIPRLEPAIPRMAPPPPAAPVAPAAPAATPAVAAGPADGDIPDNAPPGFIQRDAKSVARAAARAARLSHQQTDPGQLENLRDVLLMDPDPAASAELHELLELFGFRVHPARHIAQAADVLSRMPLVAAFVDVPVDGTDQGDGVTLLQTIQDLPRLINHPVPAVFLVSTELRPADRVRARLAGVNVHVKKPVSRGEVARALEACEVQLPADARRSSH